MSQLAIPFNLTLLHLTPEKLKGIKPVRSLDSLDGGTKSLNEDGLFSISIFGQPGDEQRKRRFSYIDTKLPILHPLIFRSLGQLKRLYIEIMAGRSFAIWNEEIKDFEKSTPMQGRTGYYFFIEHWQDIVFEQRPSVQREQNIALIKKYKDVAFTDKIVVLPAGLRDIEIRPDGMISEDEINTLYRKILSLTNSIPAHAAKNSLESLNTTRYALQLTFNLVYELLERMVEGKKKLYMGKWASRRVFNGTRNVISAMDTSSEKLGDASNVGFNDTIVGLYQYMKAALPVVRYHIRNGFLTQVFLSHSAPASLINKDTLKREFVKLRSEYYDSWMTDEGIEEIITRFGEESLRDKPLEIEGRYMGLIYKGPDNTFKIIQDIDEVPEGRDKKDVKPLTFCELMYISVYKDSHEYPALVTRYPVTGYGSIYPTYVKLKPTVRTEKRVPLDENWEVVPQDIADQYPIIGQDYVNSLVVGSAHLALLGADHFLDPCASQDLGNSPLLQKCRMRFFLNCWKLLLNSFTTASSNAKPRFEKQRGRDNQHPSLLMGEGINGQPLSKG